MKNLLIYINPVDKKFPPEHDTLTKMQIDNSLSLRWKLTDMMLVTNFDYEYRGVRAIAVDDYAVFDQNRSTKIPAINELFERGKIADKQIYWFHDHDAFQLVPLELDFGEDAAFTTHGYSSLWNAGSFFFKKTAEDIFVTVYKYMKLRGTNEQNALTYMWQHNIEGINSRYKLLDNSYNLGIYRIGQNLKQASQPVKVVHFHPHKARHMDLFRTMLPQRLMKIFNKYGIK